MRTYAKPIIATLSVLFVLMVSVLGYGYNRYTKLEETQKNLTIELENTKGLLTQKEADLVQYGANLDELRQAYASSEENGAELLNQLTEERDRNNEFESQINHISGTIGKLDKLSKIDPELLAKYSKVYFLNENFKPENIVTIDPAYYLTPDEPKYIHAKVAPHLFALLTDAEEDGIHLRVASGYRSFDEQLNLKNAYTTSYGYGANAFSADQGYSEHQLGTTVDFTTKELGELTGFESTDAYTWLLKNAHTYGFVISYPQENTYYIFEPWHWRFVGEKLAEDLHDDGKFFYDLDQREIDKYLISIFD